MPDGGDTTRDAVAAAFKEVQSREPASAPEPAAEPAPEPAAAAAEASEPEGKEPSKEPAPVRDGKGRFIVPPKQKPAASEKAPASTAPAGPGGAVSVPPPVVGAASPVSPALEALKPPQDGLKPPQNWRAVAKEKWAALPQEVKEEALRIHTEAQRGLQEASEAKKNWQGFQQTVAPYEMMLRTNGFTDSTQAVGAMLQREAILQHGTPEQKARLLASGIKSYLGTSQDAIKLLGDAWDGMNSGQQQQSVPAPIDPNQIIEQAEQRLMQRLEQARNQHIGSSTEAEVNQFSDTHEYMGERGPGTVADLVAYLLQSNAEQSLARKKAGEDELPVLSMEDAYKQAIRMHPKTAAIVAQKEAAAAATAKAATMQAARAASSSLKSEPSGPTNGRKLDVRESVAQAYYAQKNAR